MASIDESKINFQFPGKLRSIALGLIVAGIALLGITIIMGASSEEGWSPRFFISLQMALLVGFPLGLGGIYFAAIHHISGAAWSVSVRRIAESFGWFLIPMGILMVLILAFGMKDVFHHWVGVDDDPLVDFKSPWLNEPFFIIRNIAIAIIWVLFALYFWKKSIAQDENGDISYTKSLSKASPVFLIVMGITLSISSMDLAKSTEPHWFSTMWGVYTYSGMAISVFASIILWVYYLKSNGYLGDTVNENHIHDLGKYLWGHSIFWAYIAFSQFLLIWYAHIPETTFFYRHRLYDENMNANAWAWVSLLLVSVRFILPFFLLMKREAKRNLPFLAKVSVLALIGQVIDVYWVLYPTFTHGDFMMFQIPEIGALALIAGIYLLVVGKKLASKPLIPVKDPKLEQCLHFHQ